MRMDKKKLSQLRPLKKELELIDKKLDRLYDRQENVPVVLGKVVGSSKDFPYVEVRTSVLMDEPKEADEIEKQIRNPGETQRAGGESDHSELNSSLRRFRTAEIGRYLN